jgi:hypothetical protein
MRTGSETSLDVWIARNLCFLSVLQLIISFVGPFVLGLMVVMYRLIKLRHWYFHSAREAAFGVVTALLVLAGFLLIVQYWRYPRFAFRISRFVFWLCSLVYVPAWAVVLVFGDEQTVVPAWHDIREYGGLFFTALLLPAAHFVLSAVGLYASARQTPNQAMQRTAGRSAFPLR